MQKDLQISLHPNQEGGWGKYRKIYRSLCMPIKEKLPVKVQKDLQIFLHSNQKKSCKNVTPE